MLVTKKLTVAMDFQSMEKKNAMKSMAVNCDESMVLSIPNSPNILWSNACVL